MHEIIANGGDIVLMGDLYSRVGSVKHHLVVGTYAERQNNDNG